MCWAASKLFEICVALLRQKWSLSLSLTLVQLLSLSLFDTRAVTLSLSRFFSYLFSPISISLTHSLKRWQTHTHTHVYNSPFLSLFLSLSLQHTISLFLSNSLSNTYSFFLSLSLSLSFYPSIFLRARSLTHSCVTRSSVSCVTLGSAATETREPCTLARINTGITGCTK